jgi:hypothetical protein
MAVEPQDVLTTLVINLRDERVPAIRIPKERIRLFSLRPLKWLRFVGYIISGSEGDLSTTAGGETVAYDEINSHSSIESAYYFRPRSESPSSQSFHILKSANLDISALIDRFGVNDRVSDSESSSTVSQDEFRTTLIARDGCCVVTGWDASLCDACHIIPKTKGSKVRISLYQANFFSDLHIIVYAMRFKSSAREWSVP